MSRQRKIFVIGRAKTGTTSMKQAFLDLGFTVGDQPSGELLIEDWARRDFSRIVELCRTADAFQDVPFGLEDTYRALDQAFPGAKFILTVRASAEEWYDSLCRFSARVVGTDGLPTAEDIKKLNYRAPGWAWRSMCLVYGIDEQTLFDRKIYMDHYLEHNRRVMAYFQDRPQDLLVLNVSQDHAMETLCEFLQVPWTGTHMPHLNRTR